MEKSGLAFHCHHDTLVERVYDYDERVRFIKKNKPKNEQKLRLKLFKLIPDGLIPGKKSAEWAAHDKAMEARDKAMAARYKTMEAFDKAMEALYRAGEAYTKKYHREIEELHKQLCPNCPWDGKTIFSKEG